MSYVPSNLQAVTLGKFVQDHGYMRATVFTTILASALVAGCAYAPSGTLIDALEPEHSPRAAVTSPAGAGQPASPAIATETMAPLTPPVAYGPTGVPAVSGPVAEQGIAGNSRIRDAEGLLTEDAAAATRSRLQEIARSRGGSRAAVSNSNSVNQLKMLGESHGARAISEIEADGASE
jgi:hypothetical protein